MPPPGGGGASAFISSKWLKPVVLSGVLPVHATASAGVPELFKVWVYVYYNDGENHGGINGADVTAEKDGVTIHADHLTSASDGEGNGVTTFTDLPGGRYDFNCPDYDGYHITGVKDYSNYLIDKDSFDTWLEFHGEVE